MNSIYFKEPLGMLIELASYKFEPPQGATHTDVLMQAHRIRVAAGDEAIATVHVAEAIETLAEKNTDSLSDDRSPKNPY